MCIYYILSIKKVNDLTMRILKKLRMLFSVSTYNPAQLFVISFAFMILVGTGLFLLPIATVDGKGLQLVDAFFTSTSAVCTTGLAVVDTGTILSTFGQIVLLGLIQIGGLGIMTMGTILALILGKKITFRQRMFVQQQLSYSSLDGIVRLVKRVIIVTGVIEAIGALIFTLRWWPEMGLNKALYNGVFHSVSNFNNAGFDILGNFSSFSNYVSDPIINLTMMVLIITGGLGFIVVVDLLEFHKRKRLSLHTKVAVTTTSILILLGALVVFITEWSNTKTLDSLDWSGKILSSFFQSVTVRSDGSSTLAIGDMRQASLLFLIILMFIGSAPGSTGGGIRTTTFATLIGAVWAMLRGRRDVVFFKQRVDQNKVYKALTITIIAVFMVITTTMILTITERADFLTVLFEATSAYGTVGLSMGLTPDLTVFGKILISIAMFIGRLGPLTIAYAISSNTKEERYRYAEGQIIIG